MGCEDLQVMPKPPDLFLHPVSGGVVTLWLFCPGVERQAQCVEGLHWDLSRLPVGHAPGV